MYFGNAPACRVYNVTTLRISTDRKSRMDPDRNTVHHVPQRCRTSVAALVDYLDALPRDISINSCTAGAAGANGKSRILTDDSPDGRAESGKAFAGVGGDGDDGMSRLWVEVRLMCRANAQDREGAARRLWEQVVVKTEQQASVTYTSFSVYVITVVIFYSHIATCLFNISLSVGI